MKKCPNCDQLYNDKDNYCKTCGGKLLYVVFDDGKIILLDDNEVIHQKELKNKDNYVDTSFSCSIILLFFLSWSFLSFFCLLLFGPFIALAFGFLLLVFALIFLYKNQNNKLLTDSSKHFIFGFFISIIAIYVVFHLLISIFTSVE